MHSTNKTPHLILPLPVATWKLIQTNLMNNFSIHLLIRMGTGLERDYVKVTSGKKRNNGNKQLAARRQNGVFREPGPACLPSPASSAPPFCGVHPHCPIIQSSRFLLIPVPNPLCASSCDRSIIQTIKTWRILTFLKV